MFGLIIFDHCYHSFSCTGQLPEFDFPRFSLVFVLLSYVGGKSLDIAGTGVLELSGPSVKVYFLLGEEWDGGGGVRILDMLRLVALGC